MGQFSKEYVETCKKRFYVIGGIMTVVGILSLVMPMAASFAIETMVGCMLFSVALANTVSTFNAFKAKASPLYPLFMALISYAAAFGFFKHPVAGVLTISFMLSLYFFSNGVLKIVEYFNLRSIDGVAWLLFSGILDVLLAFVMWRNYFSGAVFIGVILGINLLSSGISLILLGRGCKHYLDNRFSNY